MLLQVEYTAYDDSRGRWTEKADALTLGPPLIPTQVPASGRLGNACSQIRAARKARQRTAEHRNGGPWGS